jgi:hypothetical protein
MSSYRREARVNVRATMAPRARRIWVVAGPVRPEVATSAAASAAALPTSKTVLVAATSGILRFEPEARIVPLRRIAQNPDFAALRMRTCGQSDPKKRLWRHDYSYRGGRGGQADAGREILKVVPTEVCVV